MSSKYKFHNPDGYYFVTFAVVAWVDVFTRNVYKDILIESLKYCQQKKGLLIHAYVIVTNHVHMIISKNSKSLLEDILILRRVSRLGDSAANAMRSSKESMIE